MSSNLRPYRISIADEQLDELRRRLSFARLPGELPDATWSDGMLPSALHELLDHWASGYDWRAHEAALNQYDQYLTEIDGANVHCLDVRSGSTGRPALLLLHGWPSTVAEFRKIIDPLCQDESGGFDVVVPSLPGYGFSGETPDRGWGPDRMADALAALMERLGHDRYIVHGGDVGYEVATAMGRRHRDHVVGLHLNLGGIRLAYEHLGEEPADEAQADAMRRYQRYMSAQSAYAAIQATRPQTVAYALTDSPVAQLAWIAEKYHEWADPQHPIDADEILTAASIYWFTRTAGSSARFYQENYGHWVKPDGVLPVPTAVASFPQDIVPPVRAWAEEKYQIVQWTDMPDGGHFSALETPHHVIASLRAFGAQLSDAPSTPRGAS